MSQIPSRPVYKSFSPMAIEIGLWSVYRNADNVTRTHAETLKTVKGALSIAKRAGQENEILTGFNVSIQALNAKGEKMYLFDRVFHYGQVISVDDALLSASTETPHPVLKVHSTSTLREVQKTGAATHFYQTPCMESCGAWYYADPGLVILDRRTDKPLLWVPRMNRREIPDENGWYKIDPRRGGITRPDLLAKLTY